MASPPSDGQARTTVPKNPTTNPSAPSLVGRVPIRSKTSSAVNSGIVLLIILIAGIGLVVMRRFF